MFYLFIKEIVSSKRRIIPSLIINIDKDKEFINNNIIYVLNKRSIALTSTIQVF